MRDAMYVIFEKENERWFVNGVCSDIREAEYQLDNIYHNYFLIKIEYCVRTINKEGNRINIFLIGTTHYYVDSFYGYSIKKYGEEKYSDSGLVIEYSSKPQGPIGLFTMMYNIAEHYLNSPDQDIQKYMFTSSKCTVTKFENQQKRMIDLVNLYKSIDGPGWQEKKRALFLSIEEIYNSVDNERKKWLMKDKYIHDAYIIAILNERKWLFRD